jgi:hypothetical protein
MASVAPPTAFVYIGHGNYQSIPYNERPKVPPGTIVVLFNKSGQPLNGYTASNLVEEMSAHPDWFRDPIANKSTIEDAVGVPLRIYTEGDPMPVMNYWPESTMLKPYFGMDVYQAGIYRIPLPFSTLNKHEFKSVVIDVSDLEILYPGDDNAELRKLFASKATPGSTLIPSYWLTQIQYTTPELVAKKGPGIHYFLNCRYIENLKSRLTNFVKGIETNIKAFETESSEKIKKHKKKFPYNDNPFMFSRELATMKRNLGKILEHNDNLPEDKLPHLREILVKNSALEGNTSGNAIPDEEFQKEFLNTLDEYNVSTPFMKLKRNSVKKFNETFKSLQNERRLTRQKSEEFQLGKFPRGAGGAGAASARKSRRRKTRRRR